MHLQELVGGNETESLGENSKLEENAKLTEQAADLKNSIEHWQIGTDLSEPVRNLLKLYHFGPDA